jgi:Flp pilus assembly pilin Flp
LEALMVFRFLLDEGGQNLTEYALLLTLAGIVVVLFLEMGPDVSSILSQAADALQLLLKAVSLLAGAAIKYLIE